MKKKILETLRPASHLTMQKIMKGAALLLVLATLSAPSHAKDIFGKSSYFVKITESDDAKKVKFELCSLVNQSSCSAIGGNIYYSKEKLHALRESEKWDVLTATAIDVAIVVAAALSGGAIVSTIATTEAGALLGGAAATITGGTLGIVSLSLIDVLNPHEQYMQLGTLDPRVLNDEKILLDFDVEIFVKRLSAVLDNL